MYFTTLELFCVAEIVLPIFLREITGKLEQLKKKKKLLRRK